MPTGLDHKYVNKEEHVIRYKIGDLIELAPEREEWRPILRWHEVAIISGIYDIVTEAMDGSICTVTWVVFKVTVGKIDSAIGREFEDQIENIKHAEVE